MQIRVNGTNLDLPDHVKEEAVDKLSRVEQFLDKLIDMDITFSEETNPRIEDKIHVEVALRAKGRSLRASADAADPLSAIDRVEERLVRQVRKLKNKLIERSRQPSPPPSHAGLTPTENVDVPDGSPSAAPEETDENAAD